MGCRRVRQPSPTLLSFGARVAEIGLIRAVVRGVNSIGLHAAGLVVVLNQEETLPVLTQY